MRILLIGYGKMGKEIEQISVERGHNIVGKISIENTEELKKFNSQNTDVAIEFSNPASAFNNISYCLESGIPIISGTTGWLKRKKEVENLCADRNGTFFYASNFSVGVNLFFELNKRLAELMNGQTSYQTSIEEIHHTQKVDAPSGTAITLAEGIIEKGRYKNWTMQNPKVDEFKITAKRIDPAPGTHIVTYSSAIDDLEIKHTAHSRKGFATGAVLVAEWVKDKKGILTMSHFLEELNS